MQMKVLSEMRLLLEIIVIKYKTLYLYVKIKIPSQNLPTFLQKNIEFQKKNVFLVELHANFFLLKKGKI